MARSSNIARTSSKLDLRKPATTENVVPEIRSNAKNGLVLKAVDKALAGAKSLVQSALLLEPLIAEASKLCVEHAAKHGDMMPADRLVKGLIAQNHPTTTVLSREVIVYFRQFSPIQWDAKGKVFKNKDESKGKTEYLVEEASKTAFNETAQAKRARAAADATHKQNMKPADAKMFVGRIMGQIKWFQNLIDGTDERGVKDGEVAKMKKIAKAVQSTLTDVVGKEVVDSTDKKAA